jgi:hypothetical protein
MTKAVSNFELLILFFGLVWFVAGIEPAGWFI